MRRRILLPTDFSKNAQNAIDYAINLYKEEVCDFYILNTYHIESYTMELSVERDIEASKQKSILGLSAVLKRLLSIDNAINHHFHIISECGPLIEMMKEVIDKRDIDIVVMGTKGNIDSRVQIYGSQTVLAMEHIRNCPVLAIPAVAVFKRIKEIVFLTGYKIHFKRREFQYLVDIAKISNAAIRILHVLDEGEHLDEDQLNNQKLLKDYFEGLEYSFNTLHDMEIQEALNSFMANREIDMVVFINRKHNFFSTIFSRRRPMMKELGYYSTIPILALHDFRN
ncbi:MAG: universal stress protein [Algibacter sp.]|uniref:universal stress protein n=1 Tax=Algibacter sp. TaxID=1872428 RepID=UPI003297F3A8